MSALFTPIELAGLSLENRIVVAPMCQYSAQEGSATDWHLIHLGHLAQSCAGLLIAEATAVSLEGRISPEDLGLWSDDNEQALGCVVRRIRAHSSIPLAVQLAHAGRKASTSRPWDGDATIAAKDGGWTPLAPSAVPFKAEDAPPAALDAAGLEKVKQDFVAAARRAARIGFDAVELHAAHGYLLHSFLSPLSNLRDDEYGGSLENRMRFPLRVFTAMRETLPAHIPLGVRISATDWAEGGLDLNQSVAFVREIKARGAAYVHVSSGGLSLTQRIPVAPGFQVPLAERIRRDTGLPTIAVGLITEPAQAEDIVASGKADMVALARAMLYDPRWPWHAAAALGASVAPPRQYLRAQPHRHKKLFR